MDILDVRAVGYWAIAPNRGSEPSKKGSKRGQKVVIFGSFLGQKWANFGHCF